MKIGITIIKAIVVLNVLFGMRTVFEDLSQRDMIQKHIKVGEKINAGSCTVEVIDAQREGEKVRVDVAITAHEIYGERIYKEYRFFGFYELTEEGNEYESQELQAILDEDVVNLDNLMEEGGSIYIPAGRVKVVSYLVDVPSRAKMMMMDYSASSGRTYYQLNFDIPIK